jgi:hypothetical protein
MSVLLTYMKICEYLPLNAEGNIIQGSANHLAH